MKIVIDISEDIYQEIKSNDWSDLSLKGFCEAVRNGIVLPKGNVLEEAIEQGKQKEFNEGKEVHFMYGGRRFAIRELAQ